MFKRMLFLAALTGVLGPSASAASGDVEVRLLEGDPCGACALYRSFGDGYPRHVDDLAGGAPIPVTVTRKRDLPRALATQFMPHPYWDQSLSVMVLRGDKVLYVGNMAEASDLANARLPQWVMVPQSAGERERAAHGGSFHADHFRQTWKLEYFLEVALGRRQPHIAFDRSLLEVSETLPGVEGSNVVFWGSTGMPAGNPLYISERIVQIRNTLLRGASAPNFITLYGNGADPQPDTAALVDGKLAFVQSGLDTPWSPDGPTLGRLFHTLKGTRNNLLVQVGHSGPTGAPLWGQLVTIDAPLLQSLVASTGSDVVMVSGACNSGQFANAPSCGFFAAHPNVVASGCQKSAEALRGSDDYLRLYFRGLEDGSADIDGDGAVSFSEAHWSAAVGLEEHQIPYDSVDVLVDAYWLANPSGLPETLEYRRLAEMARSVGTTEEMWAVEQFSSRVAAGTAISLTGALALNHAAMQQLQGMTEASSARRNAALAMKYPLVLSSLARRVLWRAGVPETAASKAQAACGRRGIGGFVAGRH